MSSSTAADPNGWVHNPPSVFVKVQGTSRETVNGKLGLVLQYNNNNGRYTVLLCEGPQSQVSLKQDNLVQVSIMEKAKAYYQMMTNSPEIRQQFVQLSQRIQQMTGITKPEYLLVGVVVALVIGWYKLGLTRVLLLLTTIIMIMPVIGPDLFSGRAVDMRTILQNAPNRWKNVVRQQIPVIGNRIANNNIILSIFTAVLVGFVLYSLLQAPSATTRSKMASSSGVPPINTAAPRELATDDLLQQKYYKLGFDDATNGKEFGASLSLLLDEEEAASSATTTARHGAGAAAIDDEDPYAYLDTTSVPPSSMTKKSPWSVSTLLAIFTIGRTLYPLGRTGEGNFDIQLMMANLSTLEVWRLGILGFAVYRLVAAFA